MIEELDAIRERIQYLESLVERIDQRRTQTRLLDYAHSLQTIKENLVRLRRKLRKVLQINEDEEEQVAETNELIEEMLSIIKEREDKVENTVIEEMKTDVVILRNAFSELSGSLPIEQIIFLIDLSPVPSEIRREMSLDFDDVRKCYYAYALRSAIGMCGRILELALARKYFEIVNVDPIQQRWQIGTLISRCYENHVIEDPVLGDMCNLINRSRIDSVHATSRMYHPTMEETKSLIEFTISLVKRLYPRQVT